MRTKSRRKTSYKESQRLEEMVRKNTNNAILNVLTDMAERLNKENRITEEEYHDLLLLYDALR